MFVNSLRQIRWVALIVSWVVDIGGSNVFAAVYFGALVAVGRLTLAQLGSPDFPKIILNDPALFATSMAGGTFFSVLAGYVAARMAGRAPLLHGMLSSAACLGSDVISLPTLLTYPLWLAALGVIISPVAGCAGGWLASLGQRALARA
jgi:ABC-type glycerol-3-phosphate transport system permease component